MNAASLVQTLPAALTVRPGGQAGLFDAAGARQIRLAEARRAFDTGQVLVAHATLTARRLGLSAAARAAGVFDLLELFAFVRPARFCAPSPAGLAQALDLAAPRTVLEEVSTLVEAAALLLEDLAIAPTPSREEALAQAETLGRSGWAWASAAIGALRAAPLGRPWRGGGLDVWSRLTEWEDLAPPGEAGAQPVSPQAASARLAHLLGQAGLDESRPTQAVFAAEAAFAFQPREREGEPMMMLAEAGTGVGKTMAYLAPASLWAEANGPGVWVSTYTRALQRQIERESRSLFPQAAERARKVVVRKGRENYICLLNYQEACNAAALSGGDVVVLGLVARWVRATRDGDMTGGDFPAWLPTLFAASPSATAGLTDRRGECIHAGCAHYRVCFIEKAVRGSRRADIVIANHALVMTQAAYDGARAARGAAGDSETAALRRIVFDEGHQLFDAADSAFSAVLSGMEAAEMRRWIRGPEGRGRRGRGLTTRLEDVLGDREEAREALAAAVTAAGVLPGEGWSGRIAPGAGEVSPQGPLETFLVAVIDQLRARATASDLSLECTARPALERVRETARAAAQALALIEAPLLALSRALIAVLDEEAETLQGAERARIEGALRGLDRRARIMLPAWRSMLIAIDEAAADDPDFVDWFEGAFAFGRLVDAACRRNWVDPTEPLTAAVLTPAHGVLITSATLTDPTLLDPFALAEMRTGAARLPERPKTLKLASPFDYANNALVLVVNDVGRDDPRQVAAAMRELFLASGGGALGLFTAIRRLRLVYDRLAAPLAERGLALFAQHVDPLEAGALVDLFRADEDSCLLGTDAVRDGIDVPGRALRLLVFDRTPWPRPDLLHKARRERFGGKTYDDALTRGRIAQAFGRLIRRADDRGVFVVLDAQTPTRLLSGLPEGATVRRLGLADAVEAVAGHLAPAA
jgi:ATP-dependent DNA helicase DinG